MESYDPYTDTWTPVSPALKYVSNFSAAGCQGRLYLVGSSACKYNALALQCYSPVTGGGWGQGWGQGQAAPGLLQRSDVDGTVGEEGRGGREARGSPAQGHSPIPA